MSDSFWPGQRVHIVGAAGAGMSAVVRMLSEFGCTVTGCDVANSTNLRQLANEGVAMYESHSLTHLVGVNLVMASPAVSKDHPELVAARTRNIKILERPQFLAALSDIAPVVAFAGTHGKSTTTSMASMIWTDAVRRPSWLLGTAVRGQGANGHWGSARELLMEADESYGAFGKLAPAALGILNVDPDHLDYYNDVATLERAFSALIDRTIGPVSVWTDHPGSARVAAESSRHFWRVGRHRGCDLIVSDEEFSLTGSRFKISSDSAELEITLAVPGPLNVNNAAMACAVALSRGIDPHAIISGLSRFRGAPRRFELKGRMSGTAIVDDYAHLPGEIASTIAAARASGYEKIAAVFQPHRITRTTTLAPTFEGAFAGIDQLVVTDIYSAGEPNPHGVSGRLIADVVAAGPDAPTVYYAPSLESAAAQLATQVGSVDLILVMGAGDVDRVIGMIGVGTTA